MIWEFCSYLLWPRWGKNRTDKLYIIKAVYQVVHDFAQDIEDDFKEGSLPFGKTYEPQNDEELIKAFDEIIKDVKANNIAPMLHIDGHGCCDYIQLNQNAIVKWNVWAQQFERLNKASSGNLIITLSVCYGLSVMNSCNKLKENPFKFLIGTEGDALGRNAYWRILAFYREWLNSHDPDKAWEAFENEPTKVKNNFRMVKTRNKRLSPIRQQS